MSQLDWDRYFLGMADYVATKSKDRSTKNGCLLVGPNHELRSTGYNGIPRMVDDDVESRHERPKKYLFFEHAERNAVYNAARHGTSLDGCTAYITAEPCADCSRALIQSGIVRVVLPEKTCMDDSEKQKRWEDQWEAAREMLEEANIIVDRIKVEND